MPSISISPIAAPGVSPGSGLTVTGGLTVSGGINVTGGVVCAGGGPITLDPSLANAKILLNDVTLQRIATGSLTLAGTGSLNVDVSTANAKLEFGGAGSFPY